MQAFLDDHPLELDRPTFAAAIRAGAAAAERAGRTLSHVALDGTPVAGAILRSPPEFAIGREVRMTSVPAEIPEPKPQSRLDDALEALARATASQDSAAELIQTAKLEDALRPLAAAIESWQSVQRIVAEELPWASGSEAFASMLEELKSRLLEIQRGLQHEDWSAVSDCLAFDMKEQAEGWKMLIEGVAQAERGR
jgi:hypothetical protein